jgi:hypothetical protein
MDWIDPRYALATQAEASKSRRKRAKGQKLKSSGKSLTTQVTAALAQPFAVWTEAYEQAIAKLKWPPGCNPEMTFLWSAVMQEQAEVLVRAGLSAQKLASIVAETTASSAQDKAEHLSVVVGLMDQSLEKVAFGWLDTADAYAKSALGVAALAWQIPDHARRPGNEWLTQWMQSVIDRVANYTPDIEESVICHLALQCELPLLIGVASAASKRTILAEASRAMDSLAEYLERSQDTPAPWLTHGATYLRASLASVVRCRALANSLGLRKWYPPQQRALAELLRHAARWSRPDGTQLLGAGRTSPRAQAMWDALRKQTKSPKSMLTAMAFSGLGGKDLRELRKKKRDAIKLPALTYYSDDAACVCMQSDWTKKGSRLALDFSDSEIFIEALGPKGKPVLAGEWTASVELEEQSQIKLDEWSELCWFSDEDVDYLELEAKFGQHARVQRQVVLFRQERLLLLADALLCEQEGAWSLNARIPMAGGIRFEPMKKTTEGCLVTPAGDRCLTLPLNLPEWRRQLLAGELAVEGEDLVAKNQCNSRRLYSATLISLCNSHARKPFTWRRLTVGEDLRIVGQDEAAAFRVQIGSQQWVFYRTLAEAKRRTAVGMHTVADFYAGRLDKDNGDVDTLIQVEATA